MVAGAAFADPEADFNLAEVSGNAAVTWGVDLDEGTTGFKNSTDATVKLNLVNSGTKSTEGEGIWAELGVKYDGSLQVKSNTDPVFDGGVASIDAAKLHFYNFYVGIKSGDTTVGEFKVPNAVYSSQTGVDNVVDPSHDQGIVLGYGDNKNMSFDFDFRSNKVESAATDGYWTGADGETYATLEELTKAGTTVETAVGTNGWTAGTAAGTDNYYTNDYGLAAEFKLLDSNEFLPGLFATVGGSFQINSKVFGLGASAGYKLALNETYYVKPTVGFTMSKADVSAEGDPTMTLAAGILFGWGDEADANAGVPYLSQDSAKKVTPGIGVAAYVPLSPSGTIQIVPSLYTGTLVENLTAAVLAEIDITEGADPAFGVAGGLKYAIAATDSVTVTPFAGVRFSKGATLGALTDANEANTDNGGKTDADAGAAAELLNVKVGFDVAGLINNTTFSVDWTSRDLMSDADGKSMLGTINVTCKIAL